MFGDGKFLDGFAFNEVLLDDLFKVFGIATSVPCSFRVNDGDGALFAEAEAIGFCSEDASFFREFEFLESFFEVVPGFKRDSFAAALGFSLVAAKEDVSLGPGDAERFDGLGHL